MRLLAVDIGNTDIKFGLFVDGVLKGHWRSRGDYRNTEAFSAVFRDSLAKKGVAFDTIVYSTVVPGVEEAIRQTVKYCYTLNLPMMAIRPGETRLPIDTGDYPLAQIGADRLVNICGAHLIYPQRHLVVIDFGTATTFDAITADGRYLGGSIAPGVETFAGILARKTAMLPESGLSAGVKAIGSNTDECLKSGITLGYRGLVKEILKQIRLEMQAPEVLHVATGGLADVFVNSSPDEVIFSVVDPTLTLQGLHALYLNNRESAGSTPALRGELPGAL